MESTNNLKKPDNVDDYSFNPLQTDFDNSRIRQRPGNPLGLIIGDYPNGNYFEIDEDGDVNLYGTAEISGYVNDDGTTAYTGTGDGFKDEDNMASDSATATSSQQSIKKYVDDNKGIANVVEDTTPQLGGNLDTNNKTISWESGKVQQFAMNKTGIVDNVNTSILRISGSSGISGGMVIKASATSGALFAISETFVNFNFNDGSTSSQSSAEVVMASGNTATLAFTNGTNQVSIAITCNTTGAPGPSSIVSMLVDVIATGVVTFTEL